MLSVSVPDMSLPDVVVVEFTIRNWIGLESERSIRIAKDLRLRLLHVVALRLEATSVTIDECLSRNAMPGISQGRKSSVG